MATQTNEKIDAIFGAMEKKFGFVPNVAKEMARSSACLAGYVALQQALASGVLTKKENQAVQLAVSKVSGCEYCMAAHGTGAKAAGLTAEDIQAITSKRLPADSEIVPAVRAAWLLLEKQGNLSGEDLAALEAEGIDREHVYEIIAVIAAKIMTNWVNHIGKTEIDPQFR
jgi:uncharacterized peroxidase-related enzyme